MWTFGTKVAAGFAIAFALLAMIGVVAYRSIDSLTRTSYLVAHTHQVLEDISSLLGDMKDAETGQRGFVITGDMAFLAPYQAAIADVPQRVKDLRTLTVDNQNQQRRIDEAEPLIAAKLGDSALKSRRLRTFGSALAAIAVKNAGMTSATNSGSITGLDRKA